MAFPRMARVRQKFHAPKIDNIPAEVESQLAALNLGEKVQTGQTVAITAGSRGIANIALIIKSSRHNTKTLSWSHLRWEYSAWQFYS